MTEDLRIADAARIALEKLGRPSTISEIYHYIKNEALYGFNTPTPEHVLRTTIRRHARNVARVDSSSEILFLVRDNEVYALDDNNADRDGQRRTATGMRRIYRASDKEDIIAALTSSKTGVFREIWRLLIFSAQVGIKTGKREQLRSVDSGKGIDQSTFGNCPAWPGMLYLIGLVEADSPDILSGSADAEEERLNAFQEYANGGLSVLSEHFADRVVDLDGLMAFIETQASRSTLDPDLDLTI